MTDLEPLIDVTGVRVLARYVVELKFADGDVRVIDLESLLWGPMFKPLVAHYSLFREVRVDPDAGTIVWPVGRCPLGDGRHSDRVCASSL